MRKGRWLIVLPLLVLAVGCGKTQPASDSAISPAGADKSRVDPALERYVPSGDDAQKREVVYKKLIEDRRDAIGTLRQLVRQLKTDEVERMQGSRLCYAVRMLGDMRAGEAADDLLEIIDVPLGDFSNGFGIDLRWNPPVIQALANIGKPASTRAVALLAQEESEPKAKLYVRVITLVEGADLGKEMVRLAAEKEADPIKVGRLKKALNLFKDAGKAAS